MELIKELQKRAKNVSVLYVEDDKGVQKEVLNFLNKMFNAVDVADDGEAGLKQFRQKKHDMVIADIKMPKMNGIEMSRAIKKSKKDAVIIITSAYDDKKLLLNAIKVDVDNYILKPFDYSMFIAVLYKTVSAIKLKKDLDRLHRHQQEVLDFQDTLIFTLLGSRVSSANRRFLDFFGLGSVKELNGNQAALSDFLIREEGFYYPPDRDKPFEEMSKMIGRDFRVKLLDTKNNENRIFYVRTGYLDSFEEVILSMTDISNLHDQEKRVEISEKDRCFYDRDRRDAFENLLLKEIDRSKHYGISLSLMVIEVTGEVTDENQHRILQRVIKDKISIVDFFNRMTSREYILVLVHTDIFAAVKFARMLNNVFLGEAGGSARVCYGITELKKTDDERIMIERAEHLKEKIKTHEEAFINTDHAVDYDAKAEAAHDRRSIINSMGWLKSNNRQFKSLCIYRGLQVTNQTYALEVEKDGSVTVSANKHQLAVLQEKDTMMLVSENLSYPVKGRVTRILLDEKAVTLAALTYVKDKSIADRKNIRVDVDEVIPVQLRFGHNDIPGRIVDMSIKAVGIELPLLKELRLGQKVELDCSLKVNSHDEAVRLSGEVYKINQVGRKFHVVIIYMLDQQLEAVVHKFISKYQLKIVQEMNSR